MDPHANRKAQHRDAIKKTVEKVAPEIDTTKILTDEEIEELHRQFREKAACQELAENLGREGLRARLKQSVKKQDEIRTKNFNPSKIKEKLNGQAPTADSSGES